MSITARPKPQTMLPDGTVVQVFHAQRRRKMVPKASSEDERRGRLARQAAERLATMVEEARILSAARELPQDDKRMLEIAALFAESDRF